MSHFTKIALEIRDCGALVAALADLGLSIVEVHDEPQHLHGYEADVRPEMAEVIVRREHVGPLSNDIGFRKTDGGTYEATISEYDQGSGYGQDWRQRLLQRYGRHVAVAKLAKKGFRVVREEARDGKLHVVLRRSA
ncbi:MAG: DUF1257 domain-containing protein [Deltaproteobacteria bacterium]|nr:DUF1257 domain-containing protein [Deltaproteobacteria bacterium]